MRYFCYLVSLLLLQTVSGVENIRNEASVNNEALSPAVGEGVSAGNTRGKRGSLVHGHRGQRQVGFFEAAGDNVSENEFANKEARGAGLREDEKLENEVRSVQDQCEQARSGGNTRNSDANGNPKFELFDLNDSDQDSENIAYRKQRQISRFEPADVLRGPDKPEVNKSFINLLKWNKKQDAVSDLFPQEVQKNEAFPVNDDIADFAMYLNKTKKKRLKWNGNPTDINNWSKRCIRLNEDNLKQDNAPNVPGFKSSYLHYRPSEGSNLAVDIYTGNSQKIAKDTLSNVDDLAFSTDDNFWDKANNGAAQNAARSLHSYVSSLIKNAAVDEAESDQAEMVERPHDISSVVGDVVREKTIILPEPLVFNSSHVVSSFVYTMIPFRSPLLNLLENDKHSKYIMIKIDPVLQPSKIARLTEQHTDNIEYTLEKNVMRVIEKLIGSDPQWDLTSVEGQPRSKQNNKPSNTNERYLERDDEPAGSSRSTALNKIKVFDMAIS